MIKFSIIIPTHNRIDFLEKTLINISQLDYGTKLFEILVVDNNSNDQTQSLVNSFSAKHSELLVRYFFEKRIGPSFARNTGIKNSKYSYIIFIDDDVLVAKDLLTKYSKAFKKYPKASIIGGQNIPICNDKTKLKEITSVLGVNSWVFSDTRSLGLKSGQITYPQTLISANVCVNTNITGKIFFDTSFGRKYGQFMVYSEDSDLCLDQFTKNKKLYFDSTIKSKHIIPIRRLSYKYIYTRFFILGLEQQILDKKYENKFGDKYKFNLKTLFFLFLNFIKKREAKEFIYLLKEILFIFGYFFPMKLLKNNS